MNYTIFIMLIIATGCYKNQQQTIKDITSTNNEKKLDTIFISDDLYHPSVKQNLITNDTFKILSTLDFDNGEWVVMVDLRKDKGFKNDSLFEVEYGFPKQGYYLLKDRKILKKMQKNWEVVFTGTDCCTADLTMRFVKESSLMLSLGIVAHPYREGFQTSEYGWTSTTNKNVVRKYYKYFEFYDSLIINR